MSSMALVIASAFCFLQDTSVDCCHCRSGKQAAIFTEVAKDVLWRPPGPVFARLPLSCSVSVQIRFLSESVSVSLVQWLRMVGCVYPRGAVGSRLKPWTRLRGSESHWLSSGAPCRTAWGAREQHKSAHMVRQFVDGMW